ncbi:ethylene receptor [Niveomyces insectorum RCEF 264]|uniref:Ethylene receptor n=1 Tax=Niveomyces insectorum RCEF 264 TaxID=1081102 RepID=A0A167N047_9HYPO|nr:ethylene receptor [Niveomyces insectorum RCEF 264]
MATRVRNSFFLFKLERTNLAVKALVNDVSTFERHTFEPDVLVKLPRGNIYAVDLDRGFAMPIWGLEGNGAHLSDPRSVLDSESVGRLATTTPTKTKPAHQTNGGADNKSLAPAPRCCADVCARPVSTVAAFVTIARRSDLEGPPGSPQPAGRWDLLTTPSRARVAVAMVPSTLCPAVSSAILVFFPFLVYVHVFVSFGSLLSIRTCNGPARGCNNPSGRPRSCWSDRTGDNQRLARPRPRPRPRSRGQTGTAVDVRGSARTTCSASGSNGSNNNDNTSKKPNTLLDDQFTTAVSLTQPALQKDLRLRRQVGPGSHHTNLAPAAMIGRLHDEPDPEVVTKQFLPKGTVVAAATPAGSRPGTPAPDSSTLLSLPLRPSPSPVPLHDIDVVEVLDQDDRPTFFVDVTDPANAHPGPLVVLFANAALRAAQPVSDQILLRSHQSAEEDLAVIQNADYQQFKAWVLDPGDTEKEQTDNMQLEAGSRRIQSCAVRRHSSSRKAFAGLWWTASTLRRRYRLIRATSTSRPAGTDGTGEATAGSWSKLTGTGTGVAIHADGVSGELIRAAEGWHSESVARVDAIDGVIGAATERKDDVQAPFFDWTRIALTDDLPAHIRFARSVNWAATPLGPVEQWPGDLRTMANMVMASPHPAALYWGPQYTAIYNEAYISLVGQKHPQLMGSNYADSWAEIWDDMQPSFHSAWHVGQAMLKQDDRLFITRHGFLEETFFNWSIVPLVGRDGSVVALYNPVFENTRRKVNERRMLTLNEVGEKTATAQTVQEFWQAAQKGLEYNEYDVPFALLYSVLGSSSSDDGDGDDLESDVSSIVSGSVASPPRVVLEAALGVPKGHPAAVTALDLRTSDEGFAPYMRASIVRAASGLTPGSPSPVLLSLDDGTLPLDLLAGLQGERGFDDPCRTVVVFPVHHPTAPLSTTTAEDAASLSVSGFVVMGTNPRRPYNRDYRLFVHLLARQLTTSLASVVLFEEEVRRSQRAARRAAQDRQELSQQLRIRTQQAADSENKFMRMAEFTPVGMFVADGTGRITYCNDMWYKISRHARQTPPRSRSRSRSRSMSSPASALTTAAYAAPPPPDTEEDEDASLWATWMDSVHEEDRPGVLAVWNRLIREKAIVTHEFRFQQNTAMSANSSVDDPIEIATWVLFRAYPQTDDTTGELKGIFGCITDISQQKLAEEFQIQLRQEAVEHKRQQESFIDITSHEMRNPLSAVLQSVDEITSSIGELHSTMDDVGWKSDEDRVRVGGFLGSILDATSTISLCANHQKRIVEDILTLSKLDSQLVPLTPVDIRPVAVVRDTLNMLERELVAHDIRCTLRVQPSYQTLVGVGGWLRLDASRLNQVLVDLMMNAINFTRTSENRSIIVSLGASDGASDTFDSDAALSAADLRYVSGQQAQPGLTDRPEWGDGALVNLHIAVTDSGPGLQEDEKNTLFQHFSQASPRTHVQYGGSGLGLFISRRLAELQGGQIGVASYPGEGSTFAFYVQCRKTATSIPAEEPSTAPTPGDWSSLSAELPAAAASTIPVIIYAAGGTGYRPRTCACTTESIPTTPAPAPVHLALASPPILLASPPPVTSPAAAAGAEWDLSSISVTPSAASSSGPVLDATTTRPDEPEPASALDVLIVEDNLVNQRVLQRQLDKGGNRTLVANHGQEALDFLRHSTLWCTTPEASDDEPSAARVHISIVLMDLEMPVMDGMACARAIRAWERAGTLVRHVPILAVTAYARPEQIASAKAAGIDDVISKPFRLAQLMPKIHELVTKYNSSSSTNTVTI